MQTTTQRSFVGRVVGVLKLDSAAYAAIVNDPSATAGAALVVGLTALASGMVAAVDDGITALIAVIVVSFVGWLLYTISAWYTGVELIRGRRVSVTIGEVLRVLGVAQAPGILAVFGLIPAAGPAIMLIIWLWTLVTSIVAVRQVFDTSLPRAVAISLVGIIVSLIILAIVASVLGISTTLLL